MQWIVGEAMVSQRGGALELATPRLGAPSLQWTPLVSAAQYRAMNSSSWDVSYSGEYVLFASNAHALYRHSFFAEYQILDVATQAHIPVDARQVQQAASWCPTESGGVVAYVMGYNIYLFDVATGERVAVTSDGTADGRIRNGIADWVYEEEILSGSTELFFSPDNQRLAYLRFDDSNVLQYNFTYWGLSPSTGAYPSTTHLRYPKPGFVGPSFSVHVYDRTRRTTVRVEVDSQTITNNYYVFQVVWFDTMTLLLRLMNREQTAEDLAFCDVATGICQLVDTNVAPSGWLEQSALLAVPGRNCFLQIRINERGFAHLGAFDRATREWRWLTTGIDFEVTAINGVRSGGGGRTFDTVAITVTGSLATEGPEQRHLQTLEWPSSTSSRFRLPATIAAGFNACNQNSAGYYSGSALSPEGNWMLCNYQGDGTLGDYTSSPPFTALLSLASGLERPQLLDENEALVTELQARFGATKVAYTASGEVALQLPTARFVTVPATPGSDVEELYAKLILPPDFDESVQYPVLVKVYGGPGSQAVFRRFGAVADFDTFVATRGVIVAQVDGRGTAARGDHFRKQVYERLGMLETEDQITFGRWLAAQPFVDASRLAIWGWSYGGYMTGMVMSDPGEIPFVAGMSVAPVTDWRLYDSGYTERFMNLPQVNAQGYDEGSVIKRAENLAGRRIFFCHGTGDDNVHFQHTVMLVNRLIELGNLDFDMLIYPNRQHGIAADGAKRHIYHELWQWLAAELHL